MKKNIIAVLLIVTIFTVGLFAATNPADSSFDVSTTIQGINKMKITAEVFTGTSPGSFNTADGFDSPLGVTEAGSQDFDAYLSTLSNNRTGYTVTMEATAMASTVSSITAYIDYTVGVNGVTFTTDGATAGTAVDVITVASLTGLSSESHQISLSVDQTSFDAAVEGTYEGTVTFTYTAT
ncbi:hypothetical protein [Sphaerochaeta globosa]|uniref:Uncharacterized protein n=1 Tax=Sphaerochaeta globosa (strain ATCC BAA-1886 / DSM 22777 / Buddy) TaxID=158189 RepID=F0RXZ6_SPHGB|nr:hypothetical protein [Sphaerochaeta globosa]ADY12420.1 hypothetical protein SpiBuddy_0587 [Sphaerochaeta globosa str. Buddy]